jgi:hypothetical protein
MVWPEAPLSPDDPLASPPDPLHSIDGECTCAWVQTRKISRPDPRIMARKTALQRAFKRTVPKVKATASARTGIKWPVKAIRPAPRKAIRPAPRKVVRPAPRKVAPRALLPFGGTFPRKATSSLSRKATSSIPRMAIGPAPRTSSLSRKANARALEELDKIHGKVRKDCIETKDMMRDVFEKVDAVWPEKTKDGKIHFYPGVIVKTRGEGREQEVKVRWDVFQDALTVAKFWTPVGQTRDRVPFVQGNTVAMSASNKAYVKSVGRVG